MIVASVPPRQPSGRPRKPARSALTASTAGATKNDGSWWPEWQGWLRDLATDDQVPPRTPGTGKLKALTAAPGDYVRVRH